MAKIKIYTTDYCPFCRKAKELFKSLNVEFEEIDITPNEDEMFRKLSAETGSHTVPQIFIDDKFVGGCDEVHTLHNSGKLEQML